MDCNADYEGDMLHGRQKKWCSEDTVSDMVREGGWDEEANVRDKHLEEEGMVVEVHIPTTPNRGGHMDNVEVGEEVEEDGSLVGVDGSLAHALLEGEQPVDDGTHFGPGCFVQPPYQYPFHPKQPLHFHLARPILLLIYHSVYRL